MRPPPRHPLNPKLALVLVCIFILTAATIASSCQTDKQSSKVSMVVSILPQVELAKAVGGDQVEVSCMIPPGEEPHTYDPKPSQMTALAGSSMYLAVGSGIEFEITWLDKLMEINPEVKLVDCSDGIELLTGEGGHSDPHVWLSLVNAKIMAANICNALVNLDPEGSKYYENNLAAYNQKLDQMDSQFKAGFSQIPEPAFLISHPSLSYFARDYNLTQIAVEEEGKEPTPAGIENLIRQAKNYGIKIIFTSPQFNPETAEVIANELGANVEMLDILAEDYSQNMRHIYEAMISAMEQA